MKRTLNPALILFAIAALVACGDSDVRATGTAGQAPGTKADAVSPVMPKPGHDYDGTVRKPGSPFAMSYRIVGTPIVGSPVTIDLRVASTLGPREIAIDYRINDAAAMSLHEAQPDRVRVAPADNENFIVQRVTVVPQREGRLYLNVSASYETDEGSASAIMAVPIQVGAGGRELQENGRLQLDERGEPVRVLTSE